MEIFLEVMGELLVLFVELCVLDCIFDAVGNQIFHFEIAFWFLIFSLHFHYGIPLILRNIRLYLIQFLLTVPFLAFDLPVLRFDLVFLVGECLSPRTSDKRPKYVAGFGFGGGKGVEVAGKRPDQVEASGDVHVKFIIMKIETNYLLMKSDHF